MRQLKRIQLVSGEEGQYAIESCDLVDEECESYELGRCAEGDNVEEGLRRVVSIECCLANVLCLLT